MPATSCVYILANWRRTPYIGVTRDLGCRFQEHLDGKGNSYVVQHRLRRLVYVESSARALDAIAREKQLKGWVRRRKVALIETMNPNWDDLAAEWRLRRPLDSAGLRMPGRTTKT